jgi:putative endonuclease
LSSWLYILKSSSSGCYYVGISADPARRLAYHNSCERGFTSRYRPWEIVFRKEYPSKEDASCAERLVKKWKSRKMVDRLVNGEVVL